MRLPALLALLAALLPQAAPAQPFAFAAFGDMPYCDPRDPAACRGELARVKALVEAIRRYAELFADPHSPVGTDTYANSAILQETDADRRMGEDQLRMAARPEANAASARQSY